MGGRSDKSKDNQLPERWQWIRELSSERLTNYGLHSVIQQNKDAAAGKATSSRSIGSAGNLNMFLSQEYERRNGVKPSWTK